MPTPSGYVRENAPAGTWRYRRIKEGRGVKTGDYSAPFFTRPFVNGRRKTLLAQSFKEAKVEANNLAVALHARSKGLIVSEAEFLSDANRTHRTKSTILRRDHRECAPLLQEVHGCQG